MKKIVSYLLFMVLIMTPFAYAVPSFASEGSDPNRPVLEADSTRFNTGDTIKVRIKVLGISDLFGLQFTLCYDTSLLEKESISFNKTPIQLTQWAAYKETQGSVEKISYALTQSVTDKEKVFTGKMDEAVVGEIIFVAKGEGSTGISLENPQSMGSDMDGKARSSAGFTLTVQIGNVSTPPTATSVGITGADRITVPASGHLSSAYTAVVKDQYGQAMAGEKAVWSLIQEIPGVSIGRETGVVTVESNAAASSFTIKAALASNGVVSAVKNVLLDKPGSVPAPTGTPSGGGSVPPAGAGISSIDVSLEEILAQLQELRQDGSGDGVVTVKVPPVANCGEYVVRLPAKAFAPASDLYRLGLITPLGTVQLRSDMFAVSQLVGATWVSISISTAGMSDSGAAVLAVIGSRPAIRLQAAVDGKKVQWQNPASPVRISIPYDPSQEELQDYRRIAIWEVDDTGSGMPVPNGKYRPDTKSVTFTTTHFNRFGVAMAYKTFEDMTGYTGEARTAIEVLASKGVVAGAEEQAYKPETAITRADFLYALVNTLGLTADFQTNFADVSEKDYYYQALGVAKALGITNGTGGNLFRPGDAITRQDMTKLMVLAMKAAGMTNLEASGTELDGFKDAAAIAPYAKESMAILVKAGILKGGNGVINPRGSFNRREAALVLYRLSDLV